ncbi:probable poly(beta-D-mannuronate) O-acetylase [Nonlabens tegetincola]|uniref:Probable poly(Beta-D-mannuronate) O-acetylase n=1 Tax=Nonlabens tegetincola TaxID=323273 RepID=A0A090Q2P9_9FLAO|nr:MBOAT family O-acyltransferase [Nonlabens tegetincola]GAK96462.1 probable poly(beta-D-mannuronate) O-acetylase [Nonlabens tegetincola]
MLFNSLDFAVFLPIVFLTYWILLNRNLQIQNLFLLIASYFFYGWWDIRFLGLIVWSSLVDYWIGISLSRVTKPQYRKLLLSLSLLMNIGLLGFFKYFNFFIESFAQAYSLFGAQINLSRLDIILPVGISFYTFQTLSYTIDVYRKKLTPTKDIVAFFAFVSFFPQLVAGPIERATNLLPQFFKKRRFNYTTATDGCKQILWGLAKKVIIADQCARYANDIFNNHDQYSGSTLVVGAFFFTFQIYGDFSGYSDIAIGTAKLFGFNLKINFATPYFSRDIAEFWRRWHISLSTWFRDYLYIPLGGSRVGKWLNVRNVFIVFIVSGFWHGANWTFVIWGTFNAILFLPLLLSNRNRSNLDTVASGRFIPHIKEVFQIFITFLLTMVAWIFFRADNLSHAVSYISKIFSSSIIVLPEIRPFNMFLYLLFFILFEWIGREREHVLNHRFFNSYNWFKYPLYFILMALILIHSNGTPEEFIYFQF